MKISQRVNEWKAWIEAHEDSSLPAINRQLYLYSGRSLQFLITVTSLLVILLLGEAPLTLLLPWALAMLLLTFSRLHDLRRYRDESRKRRRQPDKAAEWYFRFFSKATLSALLSGLSIPLFSAYVHDSYLTFILYFYVLGIAAGALAALFPSRQLVTTYITLLNLPLIIHFFAEGTLYAFIAGLVSILYVTVLLMIARTTRRFMQTVHSQQKGLDAKEQELKLLFEQTPTPIFYFDTDLKIRKFNQSFQSFFRIPSEMLIDNFDLRQLHDFRAIEVMQEVLNTDRPVSFEGPYHSTFNPKEYWIEATIAPLHDEDGRLIGGIASFQDKTLIKQNIDKLEQLAYHDILTNLGNRRQFLFRLKELVENSDTQNKLSVLFFLDLNQFKPINDTLGHHFGDRVLQEVSRLLKSLLPEKAELFRYGGDEFILIFPHCCTDEVNARKEGVSLSRRINRELQEKIVIDNYHLPMHSSIGIVIITPEMKDADEIVRHADISMYQAKSARNDYAFYDEEMDRKRQKNFYLRHEMNQQKIDGELRLHYQPIYSLENKSIIGAEALIRWEHPTLGLLYPDEFIPLAIEGGEIGHIGQWVANQVCQMARELKEGFTDFPLDYISFNVDARELRYQDFPRQMEENLRRFGIDPGHLILEITETSLIDNFQNIRFIIDQLESLGIRWAIDDFGVGYSSLSYLQRLSLSLLKIDQSFTKSLENNPDTVFMIKHLLKIARHLGYRIIVEGVETPRQVEILQEISRDVYCQGYYFSLPLSKEEFIAKLQKQSEELSS